MCFNSHLGRAYYFLKDLKNLEAHRQERLARVVDSLHKLA